MRQTNSGESKSQLIPDNENGNNGETANIQNKEIQVQMATPNQNHNNDKNNKNPSNVEVPNDKDHQNPHHFVDWEDIKWLFLILIGVMIGCIGLGAAALSKIQTQQDQIDRIENALSSKQVQIDMLNYTTSQEFKNNLTHLLQELKENMTTLSILIQTIEKNSSSNYFDQLSNLSTILKNVQSQLNQTQSNFTIYDAKLNKIITLNGGVQGPPGKNDDTPIGSIIFHGVNNDNSSVGVNSTWVICDGRPLLRSEHTVLFSFLGTTFGSGDGAYSFNIPDLRGRVPIGSGQSPDGLSYRSPGMKGGVETVTLTIGEMPLHGHTQGSEGLHNEFGGGDYIGERTYSPGSISSYIHQYTNTTGGDQAHENMMPFISLYAMIRIL